MLVLGIETSCDETAVALVEKNKCKFGGKVVKEIVLSQAKKHEIFGGVVPILASGCVALTCLVPTARHRLVDCPLGTFCPACTYLTALAAALILLVSQRFRVLKPREHFQPPAFAVLIFRILI